MEQTENAQTSKHFVLYFHQKAKSYHPERLRVICIQILNVSYQLLPNSVEKGYRYEESEVFGIDTGRSLWLRYDRSKQSITYFAGFEGNGKASSN